ncbi:hypothetical protein O181_040515 [Austropuccinia psidii MF-1]|uniref:Chalcone isomerase domain-containing protein n=1 Tax=Austropuccinia psidii MF-1 TaxID=1389203 RepID=A0A9Q3HG78_9BASI|nr:hypothetical protein [Austropuccinia psidii MF-1]
MEIDESNLSTPQIMTVLRPRLSHEMIHSSSRAISKSFFRSAHSHRPRTPWLPSNSQLAFRADSLSLPHLRSYSASGAGGKSSRRFRDAISDLNLKWTIPISVLIGTGLWYYLQNQISQEGRPTVLTIDEPLPPLIPLDRPSSDDIIEPDGQIGFPAELELTHSKASEPLRLVGLGIRTVSFLSVKVYSAALYVEPRVLRALRVIPGWNDHITKEKLLSASPPPAASQENQNNLRGEALIRNLLAVPADFVIRIVPVRSTDFTHLRDGFCRSLLSRINSAAKQGTLSESDFESANHSINTFRAFFPTATSLPKGQPLTLIRSANRSLIVEYEGTKLGELDDPIIARELFLAYFADQNPISLKFKNSVAEGFAHLYGSQDLTSPKTN